jgi:transcription initiation factor IIE alpha subunit
MNKTLLKQYENVRFTSEQVSLFYNLLEIEKRSTSKTKGDKYVKVFEVFRIIVHNSKPGDRGITKAEIQDKLGISRKICDDIIALLEGATLIQYNDDSSREQPWTSTIRGLQLADYYKRKIKGE